MEKRGFTKKQLISLILLTLIITILTLPIFIFPELIGLVIREQKKQVKFYFYDETSNCSLDGYVFSGEKLIGKTNNGYFNLTYDNYKDNLNTEANLSVFGKLGSCFNSELFFDKYWKSFEIKEYYFGGESLFEFKTEVVPHNPTRRELLAFIQPEKVKSELSKVAIREDTLNDLSEINKYLNHKINYAEDWDFNKETNYWQTPQETLEIKRGDCEDFSTTLLSLFLAYNSSLNCYNIVFSSHVTTFCRIDSYYIYYDQERTELKRQIKDKADKEETKTKLTELKKDYLEHYGIKANETKVYYAFNDNEFIEFNNDEDLIEWQYALENKKEFDLFKNLEQETRDIEKKYPSTEELEELRTENPTELPTLKGFFTQNYIIIIPLLIIAIILLIILIRINIKR